MMYKSIPSFFKEKNEPDITHYSDWFFVNNLPNAKFGIPNLSQFPDIGQNSG